MNDVDTWIETADELLLFSIEQGLDMSEWAQNGTFGDDSRYIYFWRKDDLFHYNMQGKVQDLPREFDDSEDEFSGSYQEVGSVTTIQEAHELLRAWLVKRLEVDGLPSRSIEKQGI